MVQVCACILLWDTNFVETREGLGLEETRPSRTEITRARESFVSMINSPCSLSSCSTPRCCANVQSLAPAACRIRDPSRPSAAIYLSSAGTAGDLLSKTRVSYMCRCTSASSNSNVNSGSNTSRNTSSSAVASLYSVRREMGASLLQVMADSSMTSQLQVDAVAKLVHTVQLLVIASPDARQFRQVLVRAAAEFEQATPKKQPTSPTTGPLTGATTQSVAEAMETVSGLSHDTPAARQQAQASVTWIWEEVQDIVVLGLGSVGTYSSLLSTGKQTIAESTRAAPRLYQLALALSLPSLLQTDTTRSSTYRPSHVNPEPTASQTEPSPPPSSASRQRFTMDTLDTHLTSAATLSFYDPAFDTFDLSLLHHLGCEAGTSVPIVQPLSNAAQPVCQQASSSDSLLDTGSSSLILPQPHVTTASIRQWVVHRPTLFYMPCCPRDLYAAVIAQNRAAGTLQNVCILGNSLRSLKDSNQLLQLLTSFGQAPGATQASFMQALQQQQRAPLSSTPTSASAPTTRPTSTWGGGAGFSSGSVLAEATPTAKRPSDLKDASLSSSMGITSDVGKQSEIRGDSETTDPDVVMATLLATKGAVVEVFAPDFSAHGVAVGLHLFPCIPCPV